MQVVRGFCDGGLPMATTATAVIAVGEFNGINSEDEHKMYCELDNGNAIYIGSYLTQMALHVAVKDYIQNLTNKAGIKFLDVSNSNNELCYVAVDHIMAIKVGDEYDKYYVDVVTTNGLEYTFKNDLAEDDAMDNYRKLVDALWGEKSKDCVNETITFDYPQLYKATYSSAIK